MKNIIIILLCSLFCSMLWSQPSEGTCTSYDRWSLMEASEAIGLAELFLDEVSDCRLPSDQENCQGIYELLQVADDHLHQVMLGNIKNNCLKCNLSNGLGIAMNLNSAANQLYNLNYGLAYDLIDNISLEISQWENLLCPDITGNWKTSQDLAISLNVYYDKLRDIFYTEATKGGVMEFYQIRVRGPKNLELIEAAVHGQIYNSGNTIDWGAAQWTRAKSGGRPTVGAISGRYSFVGGTIRFDLVNTGHYEVYWEYLNPSTPLSTLFSPGDLFGEFKTDDDTYFEGYVTTKNPAYPKEGAFLEIDSGVLYIDDSWNIKKRSDNILRKL